MTSSDIRCEALSVQDAAVILNVHENTIRNWIKDDILVAIRIGPRLLRIPRSEIARLRTARLTIAHTTSQASSSY